MAGYLLLDIVANPLAPAVLAAREDIFWTG